MAIAPRQTAQVGSFDATASTTLTVNLNGSGGTSNVLANSWLVVHVVYEADFGATVSCADNVNGSYGAAKDSITNNAGDEGTKTFVVGPTAAGATAVTVTFTVAVPFSRMTVMEVTGASATAFDNHHAQLQLNPGTGAGAMTSGTATVGAPALMIGFGYSDSGNVISAVDTNDITDLGGLLIVEHRRVTVGGSLASTFTAATSSPGDSFLPMFIALDEAVAGGAVSYAPPQADVIRARGIARSDAQTQAIPPVGSRIAPAGADAISRRPTPRTSDVTPPLPAIPSAPTPTPSVDALPQTRLLTARQGTTADPLPAPIATAATAWSPDPAAGSRQIARTSSVESPALPGVAGTALTAWGFESPLAQARSARRVPSTLGEVTARTAAPISFLDASPPSLRRQARMPNVSSDGPWPFTPIIVPKIQPSSDGRYFVDQNNGNAPFPIVGDSAWLAGVWLTLANWEVYLKSLVGKGLNTVLIQLLQLGSGDKKTSGAGDLPFTLNSSGGAYTGAVGTADFSSPNDVYFAFLKSMIDLAGSYGFVCYVPKLYWGFGGTGVEGAYLDLTNSVNTTTVCTGLGTYYATGHGTFSGFANTPNIIWMNGADFGDSWTTQPSATATSRDLAIMAAMVAGGCRQPFAFKGSEPSMSTNQAGFETANQMQELYTSGGVFTIPNTNLRLDGLYTYQQAGLAESYVPIATSQNHVGASAPPAHLPVFLGESIYANDTTSLSFPSTPSLVRKAQNWAWLSGSVAGIITGNQLVWPFTNGTWQAHIDDVSYFDMGHWAALLKTIPWHRLIPSGLSGMRTLINGAQGSQSGTPDNYVAAAQANDGTTLVAYVPPFSTGAQTFTVDLRSMASNSRGRWWDPTSGVFTDITGGAFSLANTASAQSFTTPGANAAGDNDWILLLDAPAAPPVWATEGPATVRAMRPRAALGPEQVFPSGGPRWAPPPNQDQPRASRRLVLAEADRLPSLTAAALTPWGFDVVAPVARARVLSAAADPALAPRPTTGWVSDAAIAAQMMRARGWATSDPLPSVLAAALTAWGYDALAPAARLQGRPWLEAGLVTPVSSSAAWVPIWPDYARRFRTVPGISEFLGASLLSPWGFDSAAVARAILSSRNPSADPSALPIVPALALIAWAPESPVQRRAFTSRIPVTADGLPAVIGLALTAALVQEAPIVRLRFDTRGGVRLADTIVAPTSAAWLDLAALAGPRIVLADRRAGGLDVLPAIATPALAGWAPELQAQLRRQGGAARDPGADPIASLLAAWGFDVPGIARLRDLRQGRSPAADGAPGSGPPWGFDGGQQGGRVGIRPGFQVADGTQLLTLANSQIWIDPGASPGRMAKASFATMETAMPALIPLAPIGPWGYEPPVILFRRVLLTTPEGPMEVLVAVFHPTIPRSRPGAGPTRAIIRNGGPTTSGGS